MGKKLGSQYMLWIESATPGVYNLIAGQGNLSISRSAEQIDTTTKDDGGYGTGAFGPRKVSLSLDVTPSLPDAQGYERLETLSNAANPAPFKAQVRKNGSAGVAADAVFECSLYGNIDDSAFNQGQAVAAKVSLMAAAAPTIDKLG